VGFEIVTLSGRTGTLAHIDLPGPPRVGRYGVNLADLDSIGVSAIQAAIDGDDLVVIDEIGPMEIHSSAFKAAVLEALQSEKPILGSVVRRSTPFGNRVKSQPRVELFEITRQNRDEIADVLLRRLADWGFGTSKRQE
jgi:nucleoside-triphosphatase